MGSIKSCFQQQQQQHVNTGDLLTLSGQETCYPGQGVDWPSGNLKATAIQKETVECVVSADAKQNVYTIVTKDELSFQQSINSVTTASGTGWGDSMSTSAKYFHEQKINKTSVCYYINAIISTHKNTAIVDKIVLTDAALEELIAIGAKNFIDTYGSHFIYVINLGGSFNASHTINFKSEQDKTDVAAKLSVSINSWEQGSASASTDFKFDSSKYLSSEVITTLVDENGTNVVATSDIFSQFDQWKKQIIQNQNIDTLHPQQVFILPFKSLTQIRGVMDGYKLKLVNNKWIKDKTVNIPSDVELFNPRDIPSGTVTLLMNEIAACNFLLNNIQRSQGLINYRREYQSADLTKLNVKVLSSLDDIYTLNYYSLDGMTPMKFQKFTNSPYFNTIYNTITNMDLLKIKWIVNDEDKHQTFQGVVTLRVGDFITVHNVGDSRGGVTSTISLTKDGIHAHVNWQHHHDYNGGPITWKNIFNTARDGPIPTIDQQKITIANRGILLTVWAF